MDFRVFHEMSHDPRRIWKVFLRMADHVDQACATCQVPCGGNSRISDERSNISRSEEASCHDLEVSTSASTNKFRNSRSAAEALDHCGDSPPAAECRYSAGIQTGRHRQARVIDVFIEIRRPRRLSSASSHFHFPMSWPVCRRQLHSRKLDAAESYL